VRDRRARTGSWPTRDQELLLVTATGAAGAALGAWETWKERNDVGRVDRGSRRLLPLVYRRLTQLRVDDPDLGRLKELYLRSWYRNQVKFNWAAEAVGRLREAGLDVMVLKGAALSGLYYRDAGVRPMEDVDLLVRAEHAGDALDVLAGLGWSPFTTVPQEVFLAVRHAQVLARPDGAMLDLHWNALRQPGSDSGFWEASVETSIGGETVRALCATDELLVACVHGSAWDPVHPVRWTADALTVLGAAEGPIDWDRLAAEARTRRVTAALAEALAYLREQFAAAVPPTVVAELRSTRRRLHERVGYRAALASPSPLRTLCILWDQYRRLRDLDTSLPRPPSFVTYATQTYGFQHSGQLVVHAIRRVAAYGLGLAQRRAAR
jgi:hypothetical protein